MRNKKIAYLILAHTDVAQLHRLTTALDCKARIFIHWDLKSSCNEIDGMSWPSSVTFIKDRVVVSWAGFTMVKATLNLMRAALDSRDDFSHLVLLSGLDYPLAPSEAIYDRLTQHPQRQFICFMNMRESPEREMRKIGLYWFCDAFLPPSFSFVDEILRRVLQKSLRLMFLKRKPLEDLIPAFGSQWWAITPDCASYILDYVSENPETVEFYRYSFAPDEHFFHTIIASSPYLKQSDGFQENQNPHIYKWANLHFIDRTIDKVHDESSFEHIRHSGKLFVRKVTSSKSYELIRLIDSELRK